ncbi:uncharacterized protein KD926_002942 [Aspergillus affinis]|uniref:uncharacterized protein n=1 Tax=Aspergillus affinis TaxID=1070780 RepID=UPI0022FDFC01|nr:uncharacterized protein KD926_002942 [Aspergillus affinis]KAI9035753.1 hypothetical protein KD926_002942 [Aspergillus affinis]
MPATEATPPKRSLQVSTTAGAIPTQREVQRAYVQDSEGNDLLDFVCGFSASNLGQCHPAIVAAQVKAAEIITLGNIAGMLEAWPPLAKRLCEKFGYDKVTAMTSGAEAADAACKLARGWGPASFVLGPDSVMKRVQPYHSLSTFAATAMACAVVNASLDVWEEEHLDEKARAIHEKWTREVASWERAKMPYHKLATAFGADMNLFFDTAYENQVERVTPRRFSLLCASMGLHVYPGQNGRMRLGVSLTISDEDLYRGFAILRQALEELPLYGDIELGQ